MRRIYIALAFASLCAVGAYAQQVVTKAVNCHVMPDNRSFAEAAAMGLTYMTA